MATRLRTREYWFPMLSTAVDATDTDFTQITVYLPETRPSTPFKTAMLEVMFHDRNTTLVNSVRRQLSMSVNGAGYTAVNNAQTVTNGGEQQNLIAVADFTSHFNTNFTGSSHTVDARVLLDFSGTPLNPACSNISARLVLTFEYDDTSTTYGETAWIPLNCPVGALGTSQPGTANDTIPALDTYLPEASKTFRQLCVVVTGNDQAAAVTDVTFNHRVGTGTTYTSQVYEKASNVANHYRNNSIESFATSSTHDFFLWSSLAGRHHQQAYLVVNYEYDSTASNDAMVTVLLPMEVDSPMGGTASTDYQRATRDLWIQEPGTITVRRSAYMAFWDQLGAISGLNMRIGTGSFVTYTDAAATVAGSNAAMVRNDSAFTLARGRNVLNFDVYRTDTTDVGYNVGGYWMINYTCGKPTAGYGAKNQTRLIGLKDHGTAAAAVTALTSASADPSSANFFMNSIGIEYKYMPSGTVAVSGAAIGVERLAAGEGGLVWELVYSDIGGTDGETGVYHAYATARAVFQRWPGDTVDGNNRLDLGTSRRWRNTTGNSVSTFDSLMFMLTYHTITFTCADSISGFSGTVTLSLHRESGEKVLQTTRSGDGAFSFTWYDNTEELYVVADDGTNVGRSALTLAAGSP